MDEVSVNVLENIAYAAVRASGGGCLLRVELHTAGLLIRADGPVRKFNEPGVLLKATRLIPWIEISQARDACLLAEAAMVHIRDEVLLLMERPR